MFLSLPISVVSTSQLQLRRYAVGSAALPIVDMTSSDAWFCGDAEGRYSVFLLSRARVLEGCHESTPRTAGR